MGSFQKSIILETIELRVKFCVYIMSIFQYTELANIRKQTCINIDANRKISKK